MCDVRSEATGLLRSIEGRRELLASHVAEIAQSASLETLDTIYERLQSWCANVGAFEYGYGSFDWRLPKHSNALQSVHSLVCQMKHDLSHDIILDNPRYFKSEGDLNQGEFGDDSDSEDSSDDAASELDVRLKNLDRAMSGLEELDLLIRNHPMKSPLSDHYHYFDDWYMKKAIRILRSSRAGLIMSTDEDFLLRRFAKAMTYRRRCFASWRWIPLQPQAARPSSPKGHVDEGHHNRKSYSPPASEDSNDPLVMALTIPETMPIPDSTGHVRCPYCDIEYEYSDLTQDSWREHVMNDLRPFICTYEHCATGDDQFASRSEWLKHEQYNHSPMWRCRDHVDVECRSEGDFANHMEAQHPELEALHMSVLIEYSQKEGPDCRDRCPICLMEAKLLSGHTTLPAHIAEHLEQLALSALPCRSTKYEELVSDFVESASNDMEALRSGVSHAQRETPTSDDSRGGALVDYVKIDSKGDRRWTILRETAHQRNTGAKQSTFIENVDSHTVESGYGHVLQAAASDGNEQAVQKLLRWSSEFGITEEEYGKALHAASSAGNRKIVGLLCASGADIGVLTRMADLLGEALKDRKKAKGDGPQEINPVEQDFTKIESSEREQRGKVILSQAEQQRQRSIAEQAEVEMHRQSELERQRRVSLEQQAESERQRKVQLEHQERIRQEHSRRDLERQAQIEQQQRRAERARSDRERQDRERRERDRQNRQRQERERQERERQERERQARQTQEREREANRRRERERQERQRAQEELQVRQRQERAILVETERRNAARELQAEVERQRIAEAQLERDRERERERERERQRSEQDRTVVAYGGGTSAPPWQHSQTLGGEYVYNPSNDMITMRNGNTFRRPDRVPSTALQLARCERPIGNAGPRALRYAVPAGLAAYELARRQPQPGQAQVAQTEGQPPTGTHQSLTAMPSTIATAGTSSNYVRTARLPYNGGEVLQITDSRSGVRVLMQNAPPTPRELRAEGVVLRRGLLNPGNSNTERSHPDYSSRPAGFFTVGRVFLILWTEPAEGASTVVTMQASGMSGRIPSRVRRFVVIRQGPSYCSALPIKTNGGRGVAKPGVLKSQHAIIYTGQTAPLPTRAENPVGGELPMRSGAIKVLPDLRTDVLDPMSRVDFGEVYQIQHGIGSKSLGVVDQRSLTALQSQFRSVSQDGLRSRQSQQPPGGSGSATRSGIDPVPGPSHATQAQSSAQFDQTGAAPNRARGTHGSIMASSSAQSNATRTRAIAEAYSFQAANLIAQQVQRGAQYTSAVRSVGGLMRAQTARPTDEDDEDEDEIEASDDEEREPDDDEEEDDDEDEDESDGDENADPNDEDDTDEDE